MKDKIIILRAFPLIVLHCICQSIVVGLTRNAVSFEYCQVSRLSGDHLNYQGKASLATMRLVVACSTPESLVACAVLTWSIIART